MSGIRFHLEALAEFRAAARFYESRRPGLGFAFAAEVERVASLIEAHVEIGSPYSQNLRRAFVTRFPYLIVYRQIADGIEIVAVAHQHRQPGYWRGRA